MVASAPPGWLIKALQELQEWVPRDFVGKVEINVYQGGVTSVMVHASYRMEREGDGHARV